MVVVCVCMHAELDDRLDSDGKGCVVTLDGLTFLRALVKACVMRAYSGSGRLHGCFS